MGVSSCHLKAPDGTCWIVQGGPKGEREEDTSGKAEEQTFEMELVFHRS